MFSAYKDWECRTKISINEADRAGTYYCPACRGLLYVRAPYYGRAHFCHYPYGSCVDYWHYDESEWADKWKTRLSIKDVEKPIRHADEIHRIDYLVKNKLGMMFQSTYMHSYTFLDKTDFILKTGHKALWLFNYQQQYREGKIQASKSGRCLYWKTMSRMYLGYPYSDSNVYIVAEVKYDEGDPSVQGFAVLQNVKSAYRNKAFSVKRWLTREQFIRYFNDIADENDPEAPYRSEEEEKQEVNQAAESAEQLSSGGEKNTSEKKTGVVPLTDEQKKELERRISEIKVGSPVCHAVFGKGQVVSFGMGNKYINVRFSEGEKTFSFPGIFMNGFLKIADLSLTDADSEMMTENRGV